ncbi:hypothetical protein Hypma_010678 [Hypsizygus marmoreus]|uniref:Rhodopsin domain-containing protein n=1 Tax=Hypsizygus marmoreus TaxID=39966 RepID=A0A369JTT7_HYPMA|nr:hypothetical protein Hypma_010678 [Hypsizygus marmoreus]
MTSYQENSMVSPFTVDSLKAVGLAGPIIAGVVTVIRLFERARSRRFGYDDGFAILAMLILIIFVVALFVHLGDPTKLSYTTRIGMYYVLAQGFYAVIWTARLSIIFSVIRITPAGNPKSILYGLAASFIVLWIILFTQLMVICEKQPLWKDAPAPQCVLGQSVAIAQLVSDIYADSVLIVAPLRLLWNLSVSRSQRNRLLLVFSSSIVTTVASLIHAYYVLRVGGLDEVFMAIIEICVSLLVCNLAVIVGLAARLWESRWGSLQSSGIESQSMSRSKITTRGGEARSVDFRTTKNTDSGLNVKVSVVHDVVHDGPFGDSTSPKASEAGMNAYSYPPRNSYDKHSVA